MITKNCSLNWANKTKFNREILIKTLSKNLINLIDRGTVSSTESILRKDCFFLFCFWPHFSNTPLKKTLLSYKKLYYQIQYVKWKYGWNMNSINQEWCWSILGNLLYIIMYCMNNISKRGCFYFPSWKNWIIKRTW